MYYSKLQFAVRHCLSADGTRIPLQHVYCDPDGSLVGTNGHVLAKIGGGSTEKADDYPHNGSKAIAPNGQLFHVDTAKQVMAAIAASEKKNRRLPILRGCVLTEAGIQVNDLQDIQTFKPADIEQPYPDYKLVMPNEETKPHHVIGISLQVLKKIVAVFDEVAKDRGQNKDDQCFPLKFRFDSAPFAAFVVTPNTQHKGEEVKVLAMPCRIQE